MKNELRSEHNLPNKLLPQAALPLITRYLDALDISVRIAKPRKTKLGDYRHPYRGKGHRISINEDLNPYAFLLTLVHEIAHAYNYQNYGKKVAPHGPEWKAYFVKLMQPFLNRAVFPPDLLVQITQHLSNLKASSCLDPDLTRILRKFDDKNENALVFIADLPRDSVFTWRDGRRFRKLEKLRKRYRCRELSTQRIYLFSPVAEVQTLTQHS